ncbi:MAG: DsbA family protein [Patescibacteria group bacterium UBA2163]
MENENKNTSNEAMNPFFIPIAIVIAGALIAGAMIYNGSNTTAPQAQNNDSPQAQEEDTTDQVRPVDASDHVRGNPDAPVVIVEYSDFECPFCQRFHSTLNQVMDTYGESGDVAWVFRQFPIEQLHSKALPVARASECAAELGGNDAFWQFADRYFEVSPSNNQTDIETVLPQIATELGIDVDTFNECWTGDRHDAAIAADYNNAIETGGRGTPWSIVIAPNGETFPLSGAQPHAAVVQLIEIALDAQ